MQCFDERFGPATFFITLSCAEYSWDDLRNVLLKANSDIPQVNELSNSYLCSSDPITFANFFKNKWETFLNIVLNNEAGPLGKVMHYFWRLEFQERGL